MKGRATEFFVFFASITLAILFIAGAREYLAFSARTKAAIVQLTNLHKQLDDLKSTHGRFPEGVDSVITSGNYNVLDKEWAYLATDGADYKIFAVIHGLFRQRNILLMDRKSIYIKTGKSPLVKERDL